MATSDAVKNFLTRVSRTTPTQDKAATSQSVHAAKSYA